MDNDYSRRLLSSAFNIYITNARARSINIKRKAKSQKKGGSRKTRCRNKLHINLGVFWAALWAQLIPQPPSDNCSHKHCALIGSPLCCALSAPPPPLPEMEPWIFRFKAEGTVDYSQLTFDPGQNKLIVGARYRKPAFFFCVFFFFFKFPLVFFLLLLLFSSVLLLSCLLFIRLSESGDRFLYRCFQNWEKNALRIVVFVKPSQVRVCVLMCLLQYLFDCDTESKKGFHKFSAKYFGFFYLLFAVFFLPYLCMQSRKDKASRAFG